MDDTRPDNFYIESGVIEDGENGPVHLAGEKENEITLFSL
jgi:hypothetical protein